MLNKHIVNQINHHDLTGDNTLHVISCCSNVPRWHSRYRIAREFIKAMENTPNVKFYLVEAVFRDRQPELEIVNKEHYRLVRIKSHCWIKENLLNVGVAQLFPADWKYMAWVDMDVFWRDEGWAQETLQQLQEFAIVQPWAQCTDLGPYGNILHTHQSFGKVYQSGVPIQKRECQPYQFGHPGYAWACTREFYENLPRGLMDFCGTGTADWHMAWASIGEVDSILYPHFAESYKRRTLAWQNAALKVSKGAVGFVNTRAEHYFHGPKGRRYYRTRDKILVDLHYDPDRDLMYDDQGVIHVIGNHKIEWAFRKYNLSRSEDSIEER